MRIRSATSVSSSFEIASSSSRGGTALSASVMALIIKFGWASLAEGRHPFA
ncbi:Uncharacterised protein [Mycobacterium tuberculosis]|uniref:Uncharacterized protein n=1 Tax=Mycobacterium tuberculosis TaxID=1773 RepID=A0A916L7G9_MYCTX|nr:Uncharacterised protein [Mycobacterium tuberculosis]COW84970.1 Uncharacterised protein [Mycobacterium tuberculosis]COZ38361.1 Uncharacterised protein [Mycobacterium tuberculosis]CPA98595.1 Uncharacterised protein [Mycobacterium tuberculosis]